MSGIVGNDVLGQRIRCLRMAQHLTLKQVEEASGLSATHLSEIERGRTSPTIGALTRIAQALGRDASYFVEAEDLPEVGHLPREQRRGFTIAGGARVEPLTCGIPGSLLFAYRIVLEPAAADGCTLQADGAHGEALYLVRAGQVEARLGATRLELSPHDATQARLTGPHQLRSLDGGGAEVIALLTRPIQEHA